MEFFPLSMLAVYHGVCEIIDIYCSSMITGKLTKKLNYHLSF